MDRMKAPQPDKDEHVFEAAWTAVTENTVSAVVASLNDGLDMLDRLVRVDLPRARPAIADLVRNGDLARLVTLARILSTARADRTGEVARELANAIDRSIEALHQNEGPYEGRGPGSETPIASTLFVRIDRLRQRLGQELDFLERAIATVDTPRVPESLAHPDSVQGPGNAPLMAGRSHPQSALRFLLTFSRGAPRVH